MAKEVVETTVKCPNCTKTLYQGELCSCKRVDKPSWMSDIKKNTDETIKQNRHVG